MVIEQTKHEENHSAAGEGSEDDASMDPED